MRVTPKTLLVDGDMSGDLVTPAQQVNQQFGFAIQANYPTGGSLAGVLELQCSLDHQEDANGNVQVDGTWVTITDSPKTISNSDDPQAYVWNVTDSYYPWVRVVYTSTSGDGDLTVYYFGRGF